MGEEADRFLERNGDFPTISFLNCLASAPQA